MMRVKTAIRLPLLSALVALAIGPGVFTRTQQVPAPVESLNKSPTKTLATIPAEVTAYGGIFLRARVNNSQPMWFILDSGSTSSFVIDTRRAKVLGLKLQGRFTRDGGAGPGTYEVAGTRGVSINLDGLQFADQTAIVMALASLEALAGRPLDGLVGVDLFTRYVVELDYVVNMISLYDPQTYTYSGGGESIPLKLRDGHFFVPAKFEMPGRPRLAGQFVVDTAGGMVTAVLTSPFAQANNLSVAQKAISDRSLAGLGGDTRLLVSRATSFTLGNLSLREPVIYVSQDKGGAMASDDFAGLIGSEILRRFKVVFDHAHGRLILEPNAHYAEPVEYDMSGISFRAYGDDFKTFRVYQVLADSPAAEAGLRVGDVLAAIDGVAAERFTLDEIRQMMKQQGREYQLSFIRGGVTLSMKIKTRRLL